ncbi:hypothetical protein C0995_005778 [Termitomyces sp. Mi166|nr:hypothetical protein C0995_005778 [Termitomyces sp. Mi166\
MPLVDKAPLASLGFSVFVALVLALIAVAAHQHWFPVSKSEPKSSSRSIHSLNGISFLISWQFFTKRYDFMCDNFKKTGAQMFRFRILHQCSSSTKQNTVVALSGDKGRQIFFNGQGMDLPHGYLIFIGGAPHLADINVEPDLKTSPFFVKRVLSLVKKERLSRQLILRTRVLPILLEDVQRYAESWGTEGTINPSEEIFELTFQLAVSLTTCRELAEDSNAVSRLFRQYCLIEKTATAFALLFPWFPGMAKKVKEKATKELYDFFSGYVSSRRKVKDEKRGVDVGSAIDGFIDEGDSDDVIIGYILAILVAAGTNTGMNACWNLIHLGMHPKWKALVSTEVQVLISKYTESLLPGPELLRHRLARIPLSAWENEMPILDSVIRETLRLVSAGTLLRRNIGQDVEIGDREGSKIGRGEFLAFSMADVHYNPEIYDEPMSFDPTRYEEGRAEDRKVPFGFVGWGAGRHPCPGARAGKLETKMVVALFLAGYEFEVVDAFGTVPSVLPRPNNNDYHKARPLEPCFLKFRRIVD